MLEVDYRWTSTGSSGGLTAIEVGGWTMESVLYVFHSTLATTNSVSFQVSEASTGPWVNVGTASLSTAVSSAAAIQWTGGYKWARPYIHTASTGDYNFRLVGVS